jgi:hypothetical protein
VIPFPSLVLAAALASPDSAASLPGYRLDVQGETFLITAREGPGAPFDLSPEEGEAAASTIRRFVFDHPAVFGLDPRVDSLESIGGWSTAYGPELSFRQLHRGRRVVGGWFNARVGAALDRVLFAQGRFERGIAVDPTPQVTPERAIEIAVARHPGPRAEPTAEGPLYGGYGEGLSLLYLVRVLSPGGLGHGYLVDVDAHDGSIRGDSIDPGPGR